MKSKLNMKKLYEALIADFADTPGTARDGSDNSEDLEQVLGWIKSLNYLMRGKSVPMAEDDYLSAWLKDKDEFLDIYLEPIS